MIWGMIMNDIAKVDAVVPEGYEPTDKEDFMNPVMTAFFKKKLLDWREDLSLIHI